MSDDGSALSSIGNVSSDVTARDRDPRLTDTFIAADMVGISVRVDDVADRLFGNLANGGQNFFAQRRCACIHNEYALIANLQRDVSAGANKHVDVPLNG